MKTRIGWLGLALGAVAFGCVQILGVQPGVLTGAGGSGGGSTTTNSTSSASSGGHGGASSSTSSSTSASSSGAGGCPGSETTCDGGCVSLQNDNDNCGMCGVACTDGGSCQLGTCCGATETACLGVMGCVDLMTDANHCGTCTTACTGGEACVAGMCACPGTSMLCGGVCTEVKNDPQNCGKCGTVCVASEYCAAGVCTCRPTLSSCSGVCTDIKHTAADCGVCGKPCNILGDRCVNGACATLASCTANGYTACGTGCYTAAQFLSDPENCGACGKPCQTNQVCVAGACKAYTVPVCTACPCAACGTGTICCPYPSSTFPVCVTGAVCPT